MSQSLGLPPFSARRALQWLVLAALLVVVAGRAMLLKFAVLDLDIWWHLKVGDWIIQHSAVPHTGILSRTAANRPWVAYSWGYEVLLSLFYRWFGLVGIATFGVLVTLAVAFSIFWMVRRLSGCFWWAVVVVVVTCSAFIYNLMPRPVFFSMTLFTIVLTLILEANRTGRVSMLCWLPPLFALWANLHIQFIYGLFLVGLLLAVNLVQRLAFYLDLKLAFLTPPTLPVGTLTGIFTACVLASCIGPYSYHLFDVVYNYTRAKVAYTMIIELQAINFRAGSHYMQLLLTGAGFFALGWRKKVDLFKLSLLSIAAVVGYRTMRDSWFICIPAAACLADFPPAESSLREPHHWFDDVVVAGIVASGLLIFAPFADFSQRGFDRAISSMYPVNAANFLRKNPPAGPLYNTLDWGGFLTWYMPNYPVSIDGRNDLYGDEMDRLFYETEMGRQPYVNDPYLGESGVILLQKNVPLVNLLKSDPQFDLIYEDRLASIFLHKPGQ